MTIFLFQFPWTLIIRGMVWLEHKRGYSYSPSTRMGVSRFLRSQDSLHHGTGFVPSPFSLRFVFEVKRTNVLETTKVNWCGKSQKSVPYLPSTETVDFFT